MRPKAPRRAGVLARRRFITGVGAGAALLLPMFRTMLPEALGQEKQRKRLLVYAGAVAAHESLFPTSGAGERLVISEGFSPLDPYRDEMLFLRGLDAPWDKQQHGPDWFMTGVDGRPGGITLDRYIAKETAGEDPVRSIQLALTSCPAPYASVSADGKGQVFPAQQDPVKAYADLFGWRDIGAEGADPTAAAAEALAERKSLLDFVRDDIRRMQTQLASPESTKLDQYLTGLRDLEMALENLAQARRTLGGACSEVEQLVTGKPDTEQLISTQIDVAVNALICGMTRVAVLHKNCYDSYEHLGGVGGHEMWHEYWSEPKVRYHKYHSGNLALVRKKLGQVTEGAGTVADSSLLVYFERSGINHHEGQHDSFIMTIGSLGGHLRTGRHLNFKGHNVNDAFISISNAMGVDTDTFGDPKLVKGPLPGLTA